jgi:hypothetical protein
MQDLLERRHSPEWKVSAADEVSFTAKSPFLSEEHMTVIGIVPPSLAFATWCYSGVKRWPMTDEKKAGEQDGATEQVKKAKTLKEKIEESGFIDVTKPGRGIGFIGLDEYTAPDSAPEKEFSRKQ